MTSKILTQERLRQLMTYDPDTGVLTRRVKMNNNGAEAGTPVGTLCPDGYCKTRVFGKPYTVHRLIWLYVHGNWPTNKIDHINRVTHDNRLANLREVTHSQNMENRKTHSNNRTGLRGVSKKSDSLWQSEIQHNGKRHYLGVFSSPEAAHEAYCAAAAEYHTHNQYAKVT